MKEPTLDIKARPTPKMRKAWAAIVDAAFEDKVFEEKLAHDLWYHMEVLGLPDGTFHDYDRWNLLPLEDRDKWIDMARFANRSVGPHWKTMVNGWLAQWWRDHGDTRAGSLSRGI